LSDTLLAAIIHCDYKNLHNTLFCCTAF